MKLKLNPVSIDPSSQPIQPPTPATPSIKLKFGNATTTSAAATTFAVPAPPQAGSVKSNKRTRDESDDKSVAPIPPAKKRAPGGPILKLGGVGKTPTPSTDSPIPQTPLTAGATKVKIRTNKVTKDPRPLGVGYDSEAEGAEEDPAIEQNVILRIQNGPDCDYLRQALANKTLGLPLKHGGADVYMRFHRGEHARRAAIVIRGQPYAAVLVDLPCIVESMKSWDRRGWWKCADICQMLVVFAAIKSEQDATKIELPREIDQKTWQWPHGLTPPMYNVRKRRFRKRVSYRTIEAAEDEVARLLKLDAEAKQSGGNTTVEYVDLDAMREQEVETEEDEYDGDEAAEEEDYLEEDNQAMQEDSEAVAARMALQLGGGGDDDDEDDEDDVMIAETTELQDVPANITAVPAPPNEEAPVAILQAEAEADSASDSDENEVDEVEVNEEDVEKAQMLAQQREELDYMQKQIEETIAMRDKTQNPILRQRFQGRIDTLVLDIASKKRAIGIDDEADDNE